MKRLHTLCTGLFGVLALASVGCGAPIDTGSESQAVSGGGVGGPGGSGTDETWYNDQQCYFTVPGTTAATAEHVSIWDFGKAVFPTDYSGGPRMYAVLPGTQHEVTGYPQLNHDHIVDTGEGDAGYDGFYDLYLLIPGPHFNPDTYQHPTSAAEALALADAGILYGPLTFPQANLPAIRLHAPLHCH
jgi:hypothetical protein